MPNSNKIAPTPRPSLTTNLEQRYRNASKIGVYDAKKAGETAVNYFSDEFSDGFVLRNGKTNMPANATMCAGYSI